jgi:transcriptional regulator with XRE-family HTH domain
MTPAEFRAARKALGWTQEQAAAALGYAGHRAISALEQGERQVSATGAFGAGVSGWMAARAG